MIPAYFRAFAVYMKGLSYIQLSFIHVVLYPMSWLVSAFITKGRLALAPKIHLVPLLSTLLFPATQLR